MTVEAKAVTTPASPPLTERQEARRRRILHASAQLASRGGFDAVQMREVAEAAGVALGTLYRYFPSKVHLLVATMQ
ncbi:TetR family transcriptional regulator, partial [Streptomyces sp. ADI91-18]